MQMRLSPAHPEAGRVSLSELEERIRNRTSDLYVKRGCADGKALDDWLESKAETLGVVAPVDPKPSERKST